MRIAIRADSGTQIGGGHVMRCLSLAIAARDAGHDVSFICANVAGHLGARIEAADISVSWLATAGNTGKDCDIENWRPMPASDDMEATARTLGDIQPDWMILDHYGLGGDWVKALRRKFPDIRVLALDDLDREPIFADLLLNPAAVPGSSIEQPHLGMLKGPRYAMLRPEFVEARKAALKRRTGAVGKVLVLPGMADHKNLAPIALESLRAFPELECEVIMGSNSPSRARVEDLIADQPNWSLTLDASDMAQRMTDADLCIGAGGGSAWERCSLGLPSVNVALADNQMPGIKAMAEAGAAVGLDTGALNDPQEIVEALRTVISDYKEIASSAASLCDGHGAARVVGAMSGKLRTVMLDDAKLIFDWRNLEHIRAASLNSDPLVWDDHVSYLERVLADPSSHFWSIYQEDDLDLGLVNAKRHDDGSWIWGFYIGASDAPKGAGRRMLILALRRLMQRQGFTGVRATALANNPQSVSLHETLGFRRELNKSPSEIEYFLDLKTLNARLGLGA